MDKSSTWSKFSNVEIEFIRLKICTPLTKTQHHSTFKQLIKKYSKFKHWNTLNQILTHTNFASPSQTHSLTHLLTHSQAIIAQCQKNRSPPCRRYSQAIIAHCRRRYSLSLYSKRCRFCFLDSSVSLSFSNFRFWNFMMLPRVFRFSISDLFGFWWFMFGF